MIPSSDYKGNVFVLTKDTGSNFTYLTSLKVFWERERETTNNINHYSVVNWRKV